MKHSHGAIRHNIVPLACANSKWPIVVYKRQGRSFNPQAFALNTTGQLGYSCLMLVGGPFFSNTERSHALSILYLLCWPLQELSGLN